MNKRVLVIGSNCFSASDFIDLLLAETDYDVLGVSRSPQKGPLFLPYLRHESSRFKFEQIDLNRDMATLIERVQQWRPHFVVNFAALSEVALSWKHPLDYYRINALATLGLVDALKDCSWLERYVHISTPEVYGSCAGNVPEEHPYNPSTPYASSKAAADLGILAYVKNFQLPAVLVRSTNVYGAHQQLYKIIPRTSIYLKLGKRIPLHGGGQAVKSFIHIRDISYGELAIMESGTNGECYHLSPDGGHSVRQIVEQTCDLMGCRAEKSIDVVGERLGQDAAYVIDSSKARQQLGWRPKISLESGIAGVIDWVERHWPEIQNQPLEYQHQA